MGLSPEEVTELTALVSEWTVEDYIALPFYSFYCYYYLTTLDEEVSAIWPQRWNSGKILFLAARYGPLIAIVQSILLEFRIHILFTPEACQRLNIASYVVYRFNILASELALLLCLHALLGAKTRYLVLMLVAFTGATVGVYVPQLKYYEEASRIWGAALPASQLDQDLGYACTWEDAISTEAEERMIIGGYISFSGAICISVLALGIFYLRYRSQKGSLVKVIRRDGGVYVFSLTAIRLGYTIIDIFKPRLSIYYIADSVLQRLQYVGVPLLACRLLLNMRRTEDPGVRSIVSTILFGPMNPDSESQDDSEEEYESTDRPLVNTQYAGLGRLTHGPPAREKIHA
ncbi:hypothetical protein DFP72DRAFT_1046393 [Ephemerocybe angulata]|uniref:DUF6533 domain-containing protein n=1 Tax=Ephemerocybe angulata TaxID=980116 RepID=A0A8H6HX28_9AGAR|nr:hypothetical protein DFP72DRAFT_1046393 [Tulosesus angulatus]